MLFKKIYTTEKIPIRSDRITSELNCKVFDASSWRVRKQKYFITERNKAPFDNSTYQIDSMLPYVCSVIDHR